MGELYAALILTGSQGPGGTVKRQHRRPYIRVPWCLEGGGVSAYAQGIAVKYAYVIADCDGQSVAGLAAREGPRAEAAKTRVERCMHVQVLRICV